MSQTIHVEADARAPGTPLKHYWSECVGAGRACEGLRASWQEQLRVVTRACGFKYLRFHGLFHDDMFVYREVNGQVVYNFQYVDDLFDRMLEIGVRPFVEFGFCPGDLATEKGTVFWWKAHGSPPKDYAKWAGLIDRTVRHWVDRYGLEEVRQWYFEVWNEPNLKSFFAGTRSQYFELYKVTVQTVKAVDARLRVGGPATSNFVPDARFDGELEDTSCQNETYAASDIDALQWKPVWVEAFLAYCAAEKLPVDFVSAHPYPTDWALDEHGSGRRLAREVGATPRDLAMLKEIVARSAYPQAEIHLTEWSTSPSSRDFTHDTLHAATYVAKTLLDSVGLAHSLSYWTFTDIFEELGAGDEPFHGGFGMINFQGIPKPVFHVYRFLNSLGDVCLARQDGCIVTRNTATGAVSALAYHYPKELMKQAPGSFRAFPRGTSEAAVARCGREMGLRLKLSGLPSGTHVCVETMDAAHGNSVTAWLKMGSPDNPSRKQILKLKEAGTALHKEEFQVGADGEFEIKRHLPPCAVMLLRIAPANLLANEF